jgi:hypothetical protein
MTFRFAEPYSLLVAKAASAHCAGTVNPVRGAYGIGMCSRKDLLHAFGSKFRGVPFSCLPTGRTSFSLYSSVPRHEFSTFVSVKKVTEQ